MNQPAHIESGETGTTAAIRFYVRALVVDASIEHQQVARQLLRQFGCQVDVAGDAQLAVALTQIVRYHLIFIDGEILSGIVDTSALRDLEVDGRCISVISMLEKPTAATTHRHTLMGANDVLPSPLTAPRLSSAITTWLNRGPVDIAHRI